MEIIRTVKRKVPWAEYSTTGYQVSFTPQDLGFRNPASPQEAKALYAALSTVANELVSASLLQEQVITPAEYQAITEPLKAAVVPYVELLSKMRLVNDSK